MPAPGLEPRAREDHSMPFDNVKLVERAFTEKQKHGLAARLTADTPHRAPK
jgi:hypothetical protein